MILQPISSMPPTPSVSTPETQKNTAPRYAQGPFGPFISALAEEENVGKAASKNAYNDPFIDYMLAAYLGAEQEACLRGKPQGEALLSSFRSPNQSFIERVLAAPFSASTWHRPQLPPIPPLDPQIFRHSVQTLPVVEEKAQQEDPVAESSGQAIKRRVLRPAEMKLLETAADALDALLNAQILNPNWLSHEARQQDVDLIKKCQHHLRITYTAPDSPYKSRNTIRPSDKISGVTLEELEGDESDSAKVLSVGRSRVDATTLQEPSDALEALETTRTLESTRCKESICITGHAELTFILAWEALQAEIGNINFKNLPEATYLQKAFRLIDSVARKILSYGLIPFAAIILDALNTAAQLSIFSYDTALTYRNHVKHTLTQIFEDVLAFSLEQELDMSAVDLITTQLSVNQSAQNESFISMAQATGKALDAHTEAVTSHIDKRLEQLAQAQRTPSPELDAANKKIAELEQRLAKSEATIQNKDELIAKLINKII